jgi:hypothetical protein
MCNGGGGVAIAVLAGWLAIPGASGATLYVSAPAVAPLVSVIVPSGNYFGGIVSTDLMAAPDRWFLVTVNGVDYKVPCYL